MRNRSFWCAASLALAGLAPTEAATIRERSVTVEIRPDGTVRERERLVVSIDDPRDLGDWSPYPVVLDENRRLVRLAASTVDPGGRASKVPERSIDTLGHAASGELHSSRELRLVRFPTVAAGSLLVVESEVEEAPWFSAGVLALGSKEAVDRLRVEIRGPATLRWRIAGRADLLQEDLVPGGVVFTAQDLPARAAVELAPSAAEAGPTVHFAWDEAGDWSGVGSWFRDVSSGLLAGPSAIRETARRLVPEGSDPRAALESLVRFARREVRYVAIEVGIGGYRPSPPLETLGRRWGDCKDKSFLLIDLLAAVGIPAYPALIRAGSDAPVAPEFPSPAWFDHLIVAIPAAAIPTEPGDPVAGGFWFVDPTQTEGAATWLHPGVQDRWALVVGATTSELVRTPAATGREGRRLALDLAVDGAGQATGALVASFHGRVGSAVRTYLRSFDTARSIAEAKNLLGHRMPGVEIDHLSWSDTELPMPAVTIEAAVRIPAFLQPTAAGAALDLQSSPSSPAVRVFDPRKEPWIPTPGLDRAEWRIDLSLTGCRADDDALEKTTPAGRFSASVTSAGSTANVVRETEVRTHWLDPGQGADLRELALLEHQTVKRRLRLVCGEPFSG